MKNFTTLTLFVCSMLLTQLAAAQSTGEGFDRPITSQQAVNQLEAKATPRVRGGLSDAELKIAKPEGYPATDIPKAYTGFRIEIMVADSLLSKDDELFFRHGNIMLEPLAGNRFAYTVGDFSEAEAATHFMQQFILTTYKAARIVQYKDGRRN